MADAVRIHDLLVARLRPARVIVAGFSLGSGVAAQLARLRPLAGAILVTPFDSIAAVGAQRYPWAPVRWLVRHPFHSDEALADLDLPVAVIGADRDHIVPPDRTAALIKILRTRLQQRGPTPLWNAMDLSVNELKAQNGRRVILLFTDGADNPMNFKLNNMSFMDVQRRAQESDVMVYAIGLESREPGVSGTGGFGGSRPDPGLPAIAGETGGGYFELRSAADLASTFSRVADELRRQYLIGFEPQKLDGKMHKIEVRIKKGGMKVRARKEYHASK